MNELHRGFCHVAACSIEISPSVQGRPMRFCPSKANVQPMIQIKKGPVWKNSSRETFPSPHVQHTSPLSTWLGSQPPREQCDPLPYAFFVMQKVCPSDLSLPIDHFLFFLFCFSPSLSETLSHLPLPNTTSNHFPPNKNHIFAHQSEVKPIHPLVFSFHPNQQGWPHS